MKIWIVNVESENCDKHTEVFTSPPTDNQLRDLICMVWGGSSDSVKELGYEDHIYRSEHGAGIDGIGYCEIIETEVNV